jgi:hypothetical protein
MQNRFRSLLAAMSALACGALMFASPAHAASKASSSNYQQARQACLNGQTYESRDVCLKEAAAAAGEAKKGNLTDTPDRYRQNALARCNVLPQADRDDCVRRVEGDGTASGSVGEGGILRETRTVVTEPSPSSSSPAGSTMPMPAQPSGSGGMPSRY